MSDTVALKAVVSFNALNVGDVIHVPTPLDEHNQALVRMGLLAYVDAWGDADTGSIFRQTEEGEFSTVLGVMSAPVANARRTRRTKAQIEADLLAKMEQDRRIDNGEADPESA